MTAYCATDIGLVRSSNQDSVAAGVFDDGAAWGIVCDCMGGANGGEYASSRAISIIVSRLCGGYESSMLGNALRALMSTAIAEANSAVFTQSLVEPELSGMGTTVGIAIVKDGVVYTAHAGDSRAYCIHGESIRQLTFDHSIVQEMVDKLLITPDEARTHPRRNVITRALGVESRLDIDFTESYFEEGGFVLLCSDGLHGCVDDKQLVH